MHTLTIKIQDNVLDKVIYFLSHLPKHEVEIIEDKIEPKSSQEETQIAKVFSTVQMINSFKVDREALFEPKEFYGVLSQSKQSIDDYLANSRNEWEAK